MPQSSLLAWLGARTVPADAAAKEAKVELKDHSALPTPPPSFTQKNVTSDKQPTQAGATVDKNINGAPQNLLPSNVTFRTCTKEDIPQLKRLHTLLLPLPYPESYFREIYQDETTKNLTILAFWKEDSSSPQSRLVGAIRCRILDANSPFNSSIPTHLASPGINDNEGPLLYLGTLVLLSPYRSHGIATHLLDTVTKRAAREYGATAVGAHVWEANSEALEWYRKRGFVEIARDEGYYRRLNPMGAVIVRKRVGVLDLLGEGRE